VVKKISNHKSRNWPGRRWKDKRKKRNVTTVRACHLERHRKTDSVLGSHKLKTTTETKALGRGPQNKGETTCKKNSGKNKQDPAKMEGQKTHAVTPGEGGKGTYYGIRENKGPKVGPSGGLRR